MKIVHLMGSLRPSGMERMFLSAASHFQAAGLETLVVGQGGDHPFAHQLVSVGLRVEIIPSIKSKSGAKAWCTLLRAERPDVVHIHPEGAFVISALAAKATLPRTPIVRTIHNVFKPSGKARLSRIVQGFAADKAVREFIAVSPDVRDNERSFNREARLIFNWVDDAFFQVRDARTSHDRRPSAVIVGNSSPIKNHVLALRAVRESDMDLYFHGDETGATPEETGILDALEEEGRLLHRGTSDPRPSLAVGSVFLLPSLHEGMPIALSEALVAGLPAIVNDAPGVQWARSFPNVQVITREQTAWNAAVKAAAVAPSAAVSRATHLPIDLSPSRGAAEYVKLYESVTR